jgi:hypothetical protein
MYLISSRRVIWSYVPEIRDSAEGQLRDQATPFIADLVSRFPNIHKTPLENSQSTDPAYITQVRQKSPNT